ncbi:MAG: MalM family protein [Pseudomonas sp.]|uniref:MalM family protein n=1 Tax=Pseudomonas sp. TaxID=306 RepID=UPI003395B849
MLACLLATVVQAGEGRYLTWIDDQGRLYNSFVAGSDLGQPNRAARPVERTDPAGEVGEGTASGESKRRYFTWVDGNGTLQNSFYAGPRQAQDHAAQGLLRNGQRPDDYIDADVLEGRGYRRPGQAPGYYTWVDEQGRMRNAPINPQAAGAAASDSPSAIRFTEGRQVEFSRKAALLPGLDGQPSAALQALLEGSPGSVEGLYQSLVEQCCGQLADSTFIELSADEPRYAELDRYSPSFDFPMGRSAYAALKLPAAHRTYGLRVRSFANKQLVYPSLLFLDAAKRPTRLVSDAVYQLHAETWYRYAFIEGTVPVRAAEGERYVLLLTTDQDRQLQTLDNKPFKRPLQDLALDPRGMQAHAHADEGAFELAIER